jgi:hypothetical protein
MQEYKTKSECSGQDRHCVDKSQDLNFKFILMQREKSEKHATSLIREASKQALSQSVNAI